MFAFSLPPGRRRQAVLGGTAAVTLVLGFVILGGEERKPVPSTSATPFIVARGRIEPVGRVRAVYGPSEGGVVHQVLVNQGDKVNAGQVLAILDGHDIRQAEVLMAERTLALANLQREQTIAGAKRSDIAAQRNVLAAKEARRDMLERDWKRRQTLFADGHVSQQSLDSLAADRKTAENEVAQAANVLKAQTETRGIDDRVALARIEVESASLERAKAQAEHLTILAPVDGVVLSVQSRAGELIGQNGLLRMASLDRLEVVAEIEEGQAGRLVDGMAATISARFLEQPVNGRVRRVSREVFREKRPASDVLTGRDARIVEVDITPDTPLPVILGAEVVVRVGDIEAAGAK
ncbi:HlyD family secretion protein [Magnetospirillum sulfuroxidans]|uniref:Efflux RND transporter periplasmic adaptor subunit n=1 Tax=Magnetospirillum sulfuroxidans TaxID=611300 RepID=A0ABS5IGH8_9PROT|nr:HlyD family efflux transporter periplasmic adaptor subunit [Magnetospirillum sulfuroxidans]MBR9973543.1 efflux RND transporter periplasmic adaptor subunit [Magnetospirillum sulfuroxidans]